ncbi:CapA domain-containing protein [Streptococcus pneumoniae]|uniref:CapA family protein n=1 Tax=Streptococcus pneumoniae TaxID=1313 RepID=UPI0005DAC1CF|nr:CapA family protein [Streptococcus pneumoniae]CJG56516.1 CapA domain-containing protein [Streptococcus pneumoniae]CJJ78946.1 CapA domain-containing protein [Streptococcus pneumoniae]CJN06254.1 CapA domain-containing protein [Streptococcus pneumoniae]CJQ54471.1 CapA domain-containing protein [Streptococcus pneumoniae]COF28385.1 CapA domain-containing protein [Streptococcus pneumoniae]
MAHGDLLYHDGLFFSAKKEDGTYDFHENFEYVTPWLKQADLAIGDFEGTINKDHYLAGIFSLMLLLKLWMLLRRQVIMCWI